MKIVYNIFVKVRKLWDAIFGRNGDGSEVKLAGTIDGASGQVELGEGLSLDGNTLSAEAGGTEVEPLSTVQGSEPTFRGLKIDGTDYQVYRKPVDANVGHTASAPDLQDVLIGDTVYKIPAGAYFATNTDINHISPDSFNYIVANWTNVPCFIWYGSRHTICHVTYFDGATLHANSVVFSSNSQGRVTLQTVSVSSANYRFNTNDIYVDEIEANSATTATADLTKLRVRNVTYNIPQGAEVVANPTLAGTESDLTGLEVDGTKYKVSSGTEVQANPTLAGTEAELTGLEVGGTKYKVRDGITNGLGYLTTAPTADNTDGIKIVVLSAEPATKYAGYLYIITA